MNNILIVNKSIKYNPNDCLESLFTLRKLTDFKIINKKLTFTSSEKYILINLLLHYDFDPSVDFPNIQSNLKIMINGEQKFSFDFLNINKNIQITNLLMRLKLNDRICFNVYTFKNIGINLLQNSYIKISDAIT